jgi:putative ATP-dependent endonuclease of OLD family
MLSSLATQQLVMDVQGRIAENLKTITGGVRQHYAFIGTQRVDDAYLARVLELLLATLPDPLQAVRLEAASLGYVNLLHIAVTLAGVPDPSSAQDSGPAGDSAAAGANVPSADAAHPADGPATNGSADELADAARRRLQEATEAADADQDSFFPDVFHATVVIEEPEAHLHPQLQYGLVRYLRRTAVDRPDLQVIVSTHAGELVAACRPEDLVVIRRDVEGNHVTRCVGDLPLTPREKGRVLRMTRLHLDASRSGALFADRVTLVEGVTEAALLRVLGRAWAGDDAQKTAFIDALAIVPIGHRIGSWPVQLLASTGFELVSQVAILADTDLRGDPLPAPSPPAWHAAFDDSTVRAFWSRPTLEPSLVEGNEKHVATALAEIGLATNGTPTPQAVDVIFQKEPGKSKKGEFAIELAAALEGSNDSAVPEHIASMFEWLYGGMTHAASSLVPAETAAEPDTGESIPIEMPDGASGAPD